MNHPLPILRIRQTWVIDIEYTDLNDVKPAVWEFPSRELAEAQVERLVRRKLGRRETAE